MCAKIQEIAHQVCSGTNGKGFEQTCRLNFGRNGEEEMQRYIFCGFLWDIQKRIGKDCESAEKGYQAFNSMEYLRKFRYKIFGHLRDRMCSGIQHRELHTDKWKGKICNKEAGQRQ